MNMSKTPWSTDMWNVSPFLWTDEVQKELSLPERVGIRSLDIRHSDDQAGIVLSLDDKLRIVDVIADLGVPEIECGWQAENKADYDIIKAIDKAGIDIVKSGMVRILVDDLKEQMDICVEAGVDNIKISMVPWTREGGERFKVVEKAHVMIDHAKELGVPISFCFIHTWLGDLEWMMEVLKVIPINSTEKFYMYEDGVGCPPAMRWLVRQFKKALPNIPILVHCHDPFGLGTANAIACVEAGAEWLDLGLNGYGSVAPLEQVVPALEVLYGVKTDIKLEKLYDASKTIQRITGMKYQPHAPVVGDMTFATTDGGAAANIIRGKTDWWGYNPELVGQRNRIIWENSAETKTLSSKVLKLKLGQLGLEYTDKALKELEKQLDKIIEQRVWITDEEMDKLCRKLL